jgi:hypothetical protein
MNIDRKFLFTLTKIAAEGCCTSGRRMLYLWQKDAVPLAEGYYRSR